MTITRITSTAGDDVVLGPLRKRLNRGVMVQWINADLFERAGCDVRKSIVMYDDAYSFVMALPADVTPEQFTERLANMPNTLAAMERIGIRYWSKGIV